MKLYCFGMFIFLTHNCTLRSCSVILRDHPSGVLHTQGYSMKACVHLPADGVKVTRRPSFAHQLLLVFV